MSKALGIDYGTKRVGLAITDELQIIATRLTSIHSKDLINFLDDFFDKNQVDTIVVGMPVRLDGSKTNSTESVVNFIAHLRRKFSDKNVVTIDERFTSKIASQTIAKLKINDLLWKPSTNNVLTLVLKHAWQIVRVSLSSSLHVCSQLKYL